MLVALRITLALADDRTDFHCFSVLFLGTSCYNVCGVPGLKFTYGWGSGAFTSESDFNDEDDPVRDGAEALGCPTHQKDIWVGATIDTEADICALCVPTVPSKPPSPRPTSFPTLSPTLLPTRNPRTRLPTRFPTKLPTGQPTLSPTRSPTKPPTRVPTDAPTKAPTLVPTVMPTNAPTKSPTAHPTLSLATLLSDAKTNAAAATEEDNSAETLVVVLNARDSDVAATSSQATQTFDEPPVVEAPASVEFSGAPKVFISLVSLCLVIIVIG